jgi:hypothetical protein
MKTSVDVAIESLCQYALSGMSRIPVNEYDYGDEGTVHASLKRVDYDINDQSAMKDSFGVFCGKLGGRYVVGVMGVGSKYAFHSCEVYESLEEMKKVWRLD